MNREILFRGKRVDNGDWVIGDGIHCPKSQNWKGTCWIDGMQKRANDWVQVIPGTLGQYTGLTDKNGTKIFEGDIVHCVARLDEADCIVVYDDGEFRLVAEDRYKDYPTLGGFYAIRCFEKEVIGNIHEQGV